ncbi:hypothetical protein BBJ28_00008570 [Nothophytophthora sp. Chile5]|nr:hypothetical protein BBJ28_00008570 [Nothophytophthora sp. Chile5]
MQRSAARKDPAVSHQDAIADDEEDSSATQSQLPDDGKMWRDASDAPAESETHKALDWMQRDVERQARENRAMRDTLARALHDITDVIGDLMEPEAASRLQLTAAAATGAAVLETGDNNGATAVAAAAQLVPDKVSELVAQWEDALVSWRERNVAEKQQLVEGFARFEEECLVRMRAGEASHRREQERLAREANVHQYLEDTKLQDDRLQRRLLDLTAQTKTSELRALHCEMALTQQTQRACETDARLQMLLEDCRGRHHHVERRDEREMSKDALRLYQQKLELLEGRMQDVQEQVACDHELFEYEKAKWAFKKRQQRDKYDEVLDASVKVLKVLLIREKLLKKHECSRQKRTNELEEYQLELTHQAGTLQTTAHELMQECAMVLLVLQQLAVLRRSSNQAQDALGSWTLPAKPVQMKNMIKRLKQVEAALGRRDWSSPALPTASAPGTKNCRSPVHNDLKVKEHGRIALRHELERFDC